MIETLFKILGSLIVIWTALILSTATSSFDHGKNANLEKMIERSAGYLGWVMSGLAIVILLMMIWNCPV